MGNLEDDTITEEDIIAIQGATTDGCAGSRGLDVVCSEIILRMLGKLAERATIVPMGSRIVTVQNEDVRIYFTLKIGIDVTPKSERARKWLEVNQDFSVDIIKAGGDKLVSVMEMYLSDIAWQTLHQMPNTTPETAYFDALPFVDFLNNVFWFVASLYVIVDLYQTCYKN